MLYIDTKIRKFIMVLYEPIIGNTVFNNILEYPELIKFIRNTDLKKEYEKYTTERKVKKRDGKNKK